jgi:hypothetical protein
MYALPSSCTSSVAACTVPAIPIWLYWPHLTHSTVGVLGKSVLIKSTKLATLRMQCCRIAGFQKRCIFRVSTALHQHPGCWVRRERPRCCHVNIHANHKAGCALAAPVLSLHVGGWQRVRSRRCDVLPYVRMQAPVNECLLQYAPVEMQQDGEQTSMTEDTEPTTQQAAPYMPHRKSPCRK